MKTKFMQIKKVRHDYYNLSIHAVIIRILILLGYTRYDYIFCFVLNDLI